MATDPLANLRDASFRGVAFTVLKTEDTFGQRGPTHEYPDRQTPYSEFLGRKARRFRIDGYFNGDNHSEDADRLIAAVEIPSPGTLVHPTRGSELVKVVTLTISDDQEEMLRETRFTLDCVEAGSASFPETFVPFGFPIFEAVVGLRSLLQTSFNSVFSVTDLPAVFTDESLAPAAAGAAVIADQFAGLIEWSDETIDVYEALTALRDAPVNPVRPIAQIITDAVTAVGVDYRTGEKDLAIERLGTIARWLPETQTSVSTGNLGTRANANIAAVVQTVKLAAVAERARLVFEDDTQFKSYSQALEFVEETREIIGQELMIAVDRCDQDLFDAISTLCEAVGDTAYNLAPNLPTRQIVNVCQSLPSLLASYKAYGTIDRACDLEEANGHASTFFMPPQLEIVR